MTSINQNLKWMSKLFWVAVVGGLTLFLSLIVLNLNANAGFRFSGAGGCGTFQDALDAVGVSDGDIIAQMIGDKPTGGALITKNIIIQGGWAHTSSDCLGQGGLVVNDTTGFMFSGGPLTRSNLFHNDDPVLTIDPTVISFTLQHIKLEQTGNSTVKGGGLAGVISNSAEVHLENVLISDGAAVSAGGGLHLEVRGGSRLVISDSKILSNNAAAGGGFEIRVYDDSEVVIYNTEIATNTATSGNGGGGRILIESGLVTIQNSSFNGNQASGSGGALSIEKLVSTKASEARSHSARVIIIGSTFNGNSAVSDNDVHISGDVTVDILDKQIYLPMVIKITKFVQITNVTVSGSNYVVHFSPYGYTPQLPGEHIHFFFNTVNPQYAGLQQNGSPCPVNDGIQCRWKIYPSSSGGSAASPYTGYALSEKPAGATQMCTLVANPNHSVQANTGNCYSLP